MQLRAFSKLAVLPAILWIPGYVVAQSSGPSIAPGGVVNAASFSPIGAPGGLISIFGSGFAAGQLSAKNYPLPSTLGQTMVLIDGIPAPLTYVSPTQINAQIPYEIPPNSTASVLVQVGGVTSLGSSLSIGKESPGIFTQTGNGTGLGAIQHADYSLVSEAAPALPGETVLIYGTGFGVTSPAVATGAAANGQSFIDQPTVTIGGQAALVPFAGAAPGYAGLDQINVVIPSASNGDQAIVITEASGRSSSGATIPMGQANTQSQAIPSTYFGIHLSPNVFSNKVPWPTINFGSMRLLGDAVTWADVEPSQGNFNWSLLDKILAKGQAEGKTDFLYTLSHTPMWAASNTNDPSCADFAGRTGGCYPPMDLNADGTGPDQLWRDYVTAIVQHVCTPGPCKIQSWEVWNEPNAAIFWKGTYAQLARMAQDAYQIIKGINPNLIVVSPPPASGGDPNSNAGSWLRSYLAAGGGAWADVIGFHGYVTPTNLQDPDILSAGVANLTTTRAAAGLNKPLWDTEGSWLKTASLPDPDQEAAFVARFYLLQATTVQRFYWYAYDNPSEGTLWNTSTGQLNKAGVAYGEVYKWLVGATPAGACTTAGSLITCGFTRPGGYQALAVWDAQQSCSNGNCSTANRAMGSQYVQYRDLQGNVVPIQQGTEIPVGLKPILLENQAP